jgi:hypothetical protein
MGSSVDMFLSTNEWQVHYFDTLDTKPGPDNDDEFHDALEQFADDPQIASSTSSSTVLIMLVTFATMRQ